MDAYTVPASPFIYQSEPDHSHLKLYATLGLSVGTVILLLFVMGSMMHRSTTTSMNQATNTQPRGVVPILLKDKQDLNDALKAYDNPSVDTTVNTGLDQNNKDASQFSQ